MKRNSIVFFIILTVTLFLSSCLLRSYQAFYHEKDVIFDASFLGNWVDKDSTEWTFNELKNDSSIFEKKRTSRHYRVSYKETEGKTSYFIVTLFDLDGVKYLDFLPDLETLDGHELFTLHILPVHTLAKAEIISDSRIDIKWFNEEWLGELIQKGKTDISHHLIQYPGDKEGLIVLDASTDQLQNFIRKHGDDANAFDCEDKYSGDTFCRELKRSK